MKKILIVLCALVAVVFGGNATPIATAKADTEEYVADSYKIEISASVATLPVPNVPNGWAYAITLKDGETVLGEKITEYLFNKTGEYTLVYTLHKNGSLTDILQETATLTVADMTKPTLSTDGYDSEYYVGDTLTITTAQVYDNVDEDLTATVELFCGEKKLSIQNGKYAFATTGQYRLVYKAIDKSGNENSLVYQFTVLQRDPKTDNEEKRGCFGAITGVPFALSLAVGAVLVTKKNK